MTTVNCKDCGEALFTYESGETLHVLSQLPRCSEPQDEPEPFVPEPEPA